jgi:hypothetical protein
MQTCVETLKFASFFKFKIIFHITGALHVGVTYKTGSGLDDWIYWHLIHTVRNYRQCSAIADLHTLQFTVTHSVFTSRILATDLSQSHCNFKLHMKSYCHCLIPFLPLFCNCQFRSLDSILFLCSQAHIPAGWRLETWLFSTAVLYSIASSDCVLYIPSAHTT